MISVTAANGAIVRLNANYDMENGYAEYTVEVSGSAVLYTKFSFPHFGPALRAYKCICRRVEGGQPLDEFLPAFTHGMEVLGYQTQKEVA